MSEIQFFVPGQPVAQGSKRALRRGQKTVMIEMAKNLAPWRQAIAEYARAEASTWLGPKEQLLGPLRLRLVFWFPRPAGHFGTGRNQGNLKPSAPTYRDAAPDLDKLIRAVCDGLTASGVIRDDRYIVMVEASKMYGDPGVLVNLQELTGAQSTLSTSASSSNAITSS